MVFYRYTGKKVVFRNFGKQFFTFYMKGSKKKKKTGNTWVYWLNKVKNLFTYLNWINFRLLLNYHNWITPGVRLRKIKFVLRKSYDEKSEYLQSIILRFPTTGWLTGGPEREKFTSYHVSSLLRRTDGHIVWVRERGGWERVEWRERLTRGSVRIRLPDKGVSSL